MDYSKKIINGIEISESIKKEVKILIDEIKKNGDRPPHLKVIIVGDSKPSLSYAKMKRRACKEVGADFTLIELDRKTAENQLIKLIDDICIDQDVDALMIEMPLPNHMNSDRVLRRIRFMYDIDCLNHRNIRLMSMDSITAPCTALAVMEIIDQEKIVIKGKDITVIGKSNVVGKPLTTLLLNRHATVTTCSSNTKDLKKNTMNADIVISAVGKPKIVTKDMVKNNAIFIDVGTNFVNGKMCGDLDFSEIIKKATKITPVPGGVGPVTSAMMLKILLKLYRLKQNKKRG